MAYSDKACPKCGTPYIFRMWYKHHITGQIVRGKRGQALLIPVCNCKK